MKRTLVITAALFLVAALALAQPPAKKLKVFISVDMEGISGLINWDETSQGGPDYALFRKLMTEEANAAVAGALDAGATEIVVRDAHDSARNILPDLLRPEARLIREWNGPLSMMEGLDKTFDAVVFIGNHARAGTPDAVLKHTMSLGLFDVILNGVRLPEAAWNAAIAGYFDVPVVFLSGDSAIGKQIRDIIGPIETVAVKDGIGKAASMVHPAKSREMIQKGVATALRNLKAYKPYKPSAPYKLEIVFTDENQALRASWIPGMERTGERSVAFTSNDLMDVIKYFRLARL
ncbi:MAG TPA: M55 family metallopeptidase [Acidobacteriota bacterium]|nr:M55 family metallopeptidase [Acidobacteriota bacterium]